MTPNPSLSSDAQRRSAALADIAHLNDTALSNIMLKFGLVLPSQGKGWRPTRPVAGSITGMEHLGRLIVLCTDGVVAFFQIEEQPAQLFYGHTEHFSGKVETLHGLPPAASAKREVSRKPKASVPTKSKVTVSLAMDLLARLTAERGASE